jgi:hypothetical protein
MPTDALPQRPAREIADLLVAEWTPSNVHGYDPTASPGQSDHLALVTTLDRVGAVYPSVVVTPSNQTSGGQTTYDFTTGGGSGPGQVRRGSALATVRAQDDQGYRDGTDAETLAYELRQEVERIVRANATGGTTPFMTLGSQPAAAAPDDLTDEPPVRLSQVEIRFAWLRA